MTGTRPFKKRRLDDGTADITLLITRAEQLQEWTCFQQSTEPSIRDGLVAFKDYLASIPKLGDAAQQSRQYRILKEYCEWQKSPSDDQVNFSDLLSTWAFAVDNNAEALASAVPGALAQLLRTISDILDLRSFGLGLIDSLLSRGQSKLFDKGLASPRKKPHLASPCLRLLTEMVSFDAGARASAFWLRRDMVMYKLEAVLEQRNSAHALEERRKPSARRMALRLLLAMLKYLDAPAKTDLLLQARALHVCLSGLSLDGDDVVIDILQSLDSQLLNDDDIPRAAIRSFFTALRLEYLMKLYTFKVENDITGAEGRVRESLQKLLVNICTTSKGILHPRDGWVSRPSATDLIHASEDDYIDLGLDSPFNASNTLLDNTVSNNEVAAFMFKLKPFNDALQASLLLAVFRSAPELVAPYMAKQHKLPPPSSDNDEWRARFSLLFSIVESPVPIMTGFSEPPPPERMIESIFPRLIDRKYVSQDLLTSTDEVLRISGARLLTVALKKLESVLQQIRRNAKLHVWCQTGDKLTALCLSRMPSARDVSLALQQNSLSETATSKALLECLCTFYRVLPDTVASAAFDIGPILSNLCSRIEENPDLPTTATEQLDYCAKIADLSSSTKWLHKADDETLSPLSRLLKISLQIGSEDKFQDMLQILNKALTECGVLNRSEAVFAALCNSLKVAKKFIPTPELWLFVDNCVVRTALRPVKYLDEIVHASQVVSDKKPLSLLAGAVAEQWSPFLIKHSPRKDAVKNIASWVARWFMLLGAAGENYRVMTYLEERMIEGSVGKSNRYLSEAFEKVRKKPMKTSMIMDVASRAEEKHESQAQQDSITSPQMVNARAELEKSISGMTPIPDTLEGLDKWPGADVDIDFEIATGRLEKLLLCTASTDEEIRLQAFQILQHVSHVIDTTSSHPEKTRVWLILGEICETVRQQGITQPLPTLIPELANALLHITINPVRGLYAKANKFILHRPLWSGKRVLLYWMDKILHKEPTGDDADAWLVEVTWFLDLLLKGLRSERDLDLYRRAGAWEKVSSLYSSPALSQSGKQIILGLIWQAVSLERGADMLWTRFGIYTWLQILTLTDQDNGRRIEMLRQKMDKSADKGMIDSWKAACPLTKTKMDN